ncbi:MAG: hypothetical protein HKN37_01205 [Rhodothermales bacterium]|nr:hypothetical protein [Rhodothermales bacterium]
MRIALEGLRGESSIAELCRQEGINQNLYYRWSKEFLVLHRRYRSGDEADLRDARRRLPIEARLGGTRSWSPACPADRQVLISPISPNSGRDFG